MSDIAVQYLPAGYALGLGFHASAATHNKKKISETEIEWKLPDPCVVFWRALLLQQIKDSQINPRGGEEIRAKEDAIKWLQGGKDFEMVCELADLPAEETLKAIGEALERGIQFRLPKGQGPRFKRRKEYAQ